MLRASIASIAIAVSVARADPPKRPVPQYDGRAEPSTTAGDVARGVVRVVLWPVYAVVNYGVRTPMGWLIRTVEHSRTAKSVFCAFFCGPPAQGMTFFPIVFYDFGFQSSVGVRLAWVNNFITPGSAFNLKLGFGGLDWRRAETTLKIALPDDSRVSGTWALRRRPDLIFHGIGSRTTSAARARYTLTHAELTFGAGWRGLNAYAGVHTIAATESNFSDDLSIDDQVDVGRIPERPPGYGELLVIERFGAKLGLDSRRKVKTRSGARLDLTVERARERERGGWTMIEGTLGGALKMDPVGEYKLDLRLRVQLIEPDDGVEPPFLELASIGGTRDLRGHANGRGRGFSAAALTLDYQWPLAAWLDATFYAGAGNVYGEKLSGLHLGSLRGSLGGGLAIAGLSAERQIELWSAVGTDPFDEGFEISSFRLVLAYSRDY